MPGLDSGIAKGLFRRGQAAAIQEQRRLSLQEQIAAAQDVTARRGQDMRGEQARKKAEALSEQQRKTLLGTLDKGYRETLNALQIGLNAGKLFKDMRGLMGAAEQLSNGMREAGGDPSGLDKILIAMQKNAVPGAAAVRVGQTEGKAALAKATGGGAAAAGITARATATGAAQGTAAGTPLDFTEASSKMATTASTLLKQGLDPLAVRDTLSAMTGGNPRLVQFAQRLTETLGKFGEAAAQRKLDDGMKRVDLLVKEGGIDRELAFLSQFGKAGTMIQLDPTQFGKGQIATLQNQLVQISTARRLIDDSIPLINDQTIGVWGVLNREVGGRAQQLAITRPLAWVASKITGGAFSPEVVKQAKDAFTQFATMNEAIKRLIVQKGGRLSNEDRTFVEKATGLLSASTDVASARGIMTRLQNILDNLEGETLGLLSKGGVGPDVFDVTFGPDGAPIFTPAEK